jgi:PAS domain-containing protein
MNVSAEAVRAHVPLEDLQASDVKVESRQCQDGLYQHEFRLRMPDGSERWLGAHAAIRSNRIFGVNFDITQRKRAELALRESEARLRIATSAAALGVFERDVKADRTVWMNDRIYEIFGRTRADGSLTRQQFEEEYLHPDDAHAVEEARQDAIRSGGSFRVVCRIRIKGSLQRWLQFDGAYEFTSTGEPSRLIGVIADITEPRGGGSRIRSFPSVWRLFKMKSVSALRKNCTIPLSSILSPPTSI